MRVVYGNIGKPTQIAAGLTQKQAEAYAERMNKQAPQYNHRVVPEGDEKKKG